MPPRHTASQFRRGSADTWTRRSRPPVIDSLEIYGLPSKGETRLHDHKTQEEFFGTIVERYRKFCAASDKEHGLETAFGSLTLQEDITSGRPAQDGAASAPKADRDRYDVFPRVQDTDRPGDLPTILMAMRKLREGIIGSRRRDKFAQKAYVFVIHASILTRSWESYQPALLYLLHQIHPQTPLPESEMQEFVGYRILDLACRQDELREALALMLPRGDQDRRVRATVLALVKNDWVQFWRARRAANEYQRAIMEFAVERTRLHALRCLARSYMTADKAFVERTGDAQFGDLAKGEFSWSLNDAGNVVIRKPKPR